MSPRVLRSGTAYLQVRPGRMYHDLTVVKATQRKPKVIDPECVVVKIELHIPDAAFQPLQPEAIVTVPEELVQHPVTVTAEGPD